jgi:hypothetical protein
MKIELYCTCGHTEGLHLLGNDATLSIRDQAVVTKFGEFCFECDKFHEFKRDNLKYLEQLSER